MSEIHKLHGKLLTRRPTRHEEPVEYQDGCSRLRRYAQSRGIDIDTRRESLIDRGIGWKTLLAYNGTIWGSFTLRGSSRSCQAMAWIESPGPYRVYKSAFCCSSFFPPFFSSFARYPCPRRWSIDRSIRPRSIVLHRRGESGVEFNVGHQGKYRTHVRECRSSAAAFDRQEIWARLSAELSSWFIADPPLPLIARTATSKPCAGVCEVFLRA